MNGIASKIRHNYSKVSRLLLMVVAFGLLLFISPRERSFKYDYSPGFPWMHEDLYAEFDFPIEKPEEVIEAERQEVIRKHPLFFDLDRSVKDSVLKAFETAVDTYVSKAENKENTGLEEKLRYHGRRLLTEIYSKGIIESIDSIENKPPDFLIRLVEGNKEKPVELRSFYTIKSAFDKVKSTVGENKDIPDELNNLIAGVLRPDILFNEQLTRSVLNDKLDAIPLVYGKVSKGEIIVGRGEIITKETARKLDSYRKLYSERKGADRNRWLIYSGKAVYAFFALMLIIGFLRLFAIDIYSRMNKFTLIILLFLMNYYLASLTIYYPDINIYALPFIGFAVIMLSFFRADVVAYLFLIFMLVAALVAPHGLSFLWIEIPAGMATIFFLKEMRKRSQLFGVIVLIFIISSAIYLAAELTIEGSLDNIEWQNLAWFGISSLLTLLAIPLIFLFERVFGLVSEMALLELVDTNNKLLRELSLKAPGTFQHSLQVANLAEECALEIGGDPLLVRVGALYHDVGKMLNPSYFIENQNAGYNPHDDLTPKESAAIIIRHVVDGVELAKKHKIPEKIIDFIRTHHGTTVTRYFLFHARKDDPGVDEELFRYPGPLPFSKETAILMMCDGVEAASRSLPEYTKESVDELVENIINYLIDSGQLSYAPITLEEISVLKRLLKRRLMTIYHVRVAYPSEQE